MDEIRCDEESYLIWKWHPAGVEQGTGDRENAIRWGSSLRVKDGEVEMCIRDRLQPILRKMLERASPITVERK